MLQQQDKPYQVVKLKTKDQVLLPFPMLKSTPFLQQSCWFQGQTKSLERKRNKTDNMLQYLGLQFVYFSKAN